MSVSNRSENFVAADGIENPLSTKNKSKLSYLIDLFIERQMLNEKINLKRFTDEFVLMMRGVECSEGTKLHSHKEFVLETDFLSLRNWIFAQLKEATKKNSSVYNRLAANGFKVEVFVEGTNSFVRLNRKQTSTSKKNFVQLNQLKDSVSEEVSSDNDDDIPGMLPEEFCNVVFESPAYNVKVDYDADCHLVSNEEYLAEGKHLPQIKTHSVKAA
jgi:hypothetical protein